MSGRWLHRRPVLDPVARLVCLPHAGGTAGAFAHWGELLPPRVELVAVQYPGRQDRLDEPACEDMDELADGVVTALRDLTDLPVVMFGHSMGSGLAHAVARRMHHDSASLPEHLFVSARPAPHRVQGEHRHRLSDGDLVAEMRRLGGSDIQVYDHPELLPLILSPLRADLQLLDDYRPTTTPPVACPLTALGGSADPTCPAAELDSWAQTTTAEFRKVVLPGGHHAVRERTDDVLALVRAALPTRVVP